MELGGIETERNDAQTESLILNNWVCQLLPVIHPRLLACGQALHKLTKKGVVWKWAKDKQMAFEELKQLITSTPILVQPDQYVQFQLEMDALAMPQEQF